MTGIWKRVGLMMGRVKVDYNMSKNARLAFLIHFPPLKCHGNLEVTREISDLVFICKALHNLVNFNVYGYVTFLDHDLIRFSQNTKISILQH